jgi:hypothetical protein
LEEKKKPVLDVDGAAEEDPTSTAITDVIVEDESVVPGDFTTTFFLALKYLPFLFWLIVVLKDWTPHPYLRNLVRSS